MIFQKNRPQNIMIVLLVLFIQQAALITEMYRFRNAHVTPMSVKRGLDTLADGLCYYYDDGMVKLINPAMNTIAEDVLGRSITDGSIFWEHVSEAKALYGTFPEKGENPVFRTSSGNVYSFRRTEKSFLKRPIIELIAYDITDEVEQGEKLREQCTP